MIFGRMISFLYRTTMEDFSQMRPPKLIYYIWYTLINLLAKQGTLIKSEKTKQRILDVILDKLLTQMTIVNLLWEINTLTPFSTMSQKIYVKYYLYL